MPPPFLAGGWKLVVVASGSSLSRSATGNGGDLLLLGLHDVGQGRVARYVEPELAGDQGRGLQLDDPFDAPFQFAFGGDRAVVIVEADEGGGAGEAELFGDRDADLGRAAVLGLHAGEDEVKAFVFGIGGDDRGDLPGVFGRSGRVLDMDGVVAPHGQRFLDRFDHAVGADGEDGQFGAVTQFFPELNGLFHGVFVVFVHAEGQIGFVVPDAGGVRV